MYSNFSISPSNEYSGLTSFRIDWFDLLAVQGTLKSLLQHYRLKASILWRSAFFIVQLLHPYMTPGKTIVLTRQTFFGKVMSLLFKMLSRFVIAFLPKIKCLLISWLFFYQNFYFIDNSVMDMSYFFDMKGKRKAHLQLLSSSPPQLFGQYYYCKICYAGKI